MERFLDWLSDELFGKKLVFFVFLALVIKFISQVLIISFFPFTVDNTSPWEVIGLPINAFIILPLFGRAFLEEVLYRLAPLYVAIETWGSSWKVLVIAGISSIVFGFAHGNVYNVLFQGMGGLFYCTVFLKCGGFNKNYSKALVSTSILHLFWNLMFCASMYQNGIYVM